MGCGVSLAHHHRTRELVHRAYLRACKRRELEAQGLPVGDTTDPDELWRRRFEDVIYSYIHREKGKSHLRVLPGLGQGEPSQPRVQRPVSPIGSHHLAGGAGGSLSGERQPALQEDAVVGQAQAVCGDEPASVAQEQPGRHPTHDYFDEGETA
jgi:hypothetical protein